MTGCYKHFGTLCLYYIQQEKEEEEEEELGSISLHEDEEEEEDDKEEEEEGGSGLKALVTGSEEKFSDVIEMAAKFQPTGNTLVIYFFDFTNRKCLYVILHVQNRRGGGKNYGYSAFLKDLFGVKLPEEFKPVI